MARPLRVEFDDAIYHVTSRGNAREDIFDDGEDRNQARRTDCPGGTSLRVQPERGCRFCGPTLPYGQPVGKQASIQETRLDPEPESDLLGLRLSRRMWTAASQRTGQMNCVRS